MSKWIELLEEKYKKNEEEVWDMLNSCPWFDEVEEYH